MRHSRRLKQAQQGFSLLEMLVSLTITVMVMAGVLTLFQTTGRIAKTQTDLSDMQQNMRVALYDTLRHSRMAGRGGLPISLLPNLPAFGGHLLPEGASLAVTNNVGPATLICPSCTPMVLENTDVLTVRGVLFGSVYQSRISTNEFAGDQLTVGALSAMGVEQDLTGLADAVDDAGTDPEALVMVSPMGNSLYCVVELTGGTVTRDTATNEPLSVTLDFVRAGGTRQNDYLQLMPNALFPPQMKSAAYVGILEEYRYFVRESHADPSDLNSLLIPRLTRARFYPGSAVVHPSNPTAQEDISDNVWDFQVSMGIDVDGDGEVEEGNDPVTLAADEWLFNHEDDVVDDPDTPAAWVWNAGGPFELLRVTALVRTDRRDPKYISPAITAIEDHLWNEPATPASGDFDIRQFRRRQVTSTIDLRNL